jgi:hypothetical protein
VLRLSLHPQGLASRIVNLGQWRHHLFERLRQQIQATGDRDLQALQEELRRYPQPDDADETRLEGEVLGIAMPLRLRTPAGILSFISTTTIFGTPVDVTLAGAGAGDLLSGGCDDGACAANLAGKRRGSGCAAHPDLRMDRGVGSR